MLKIDCLVIGAGVIGLTIARALAKTGREVIVLEQEQYIGEHTSSRNSEVIHAGIYNPPQWKKTQYCVAGKPSLYQYCEEFGVPYKRCGKLIVATNSQQVEQLHAIRKRAHINRVTDVEFMHVDEIHQREPALAVKAGLFSPSTGIIDSHAYMLSLQGEVERHGGHLTLKHRVVGGRAGHKQHHLDIATDQQQFTISANTVINAAGLFASQLTKSIDGFKPEHIPETYYARGNYFKYNGRSPFSHLIYPIPEKMGLGVHLTLDIQGKAKFGPDVEWIDDINYQQDTNRSEGFYQAIRSYWPDLPDNSLSPDYAGIRPKLSKADGEPQDFILQSPADTGISRWVNLYGIESPGLTSSLYIADTVTAMVAD